MKRVLGLLGFVFVGCGPGTPPPATQSTVSGFKLESGIQTVKIVGATYLCYLGTTTKSAEVTVKVAGKLGQGTVKIECPPGQVIKSITHPDAGDVSELVQVPGNAFQLVFDRATDARPLLEVESIKTTEVASIPLPEEAVEFTSRVMRSFPLPLNQPLVLPSDPLVERRYYLTVDRVKGKELELATSGAGRKVYESNHEHGFNVTLTGNTSVDKEGIDVTTLPVDQSDDKLLLTVVVKPNANKESLQLSVNEKVKVVDMNVWFRGNVSAFGDSSGSVLQKLDSFAEAASGLLYNASRGHLRLGKLRTRIGLTPDPNAQPDIIVDSIPGAGIGAVIDPVRKGIGFGKLWWNATADDASLSLARAVFIRDGNLVEEWQGPTILCNASMMGTPTSLLICVPANHGQARALDNPSLSGWERLSSKLGVTFQNRTPTLIFPGVVSLPVETR